MTNFEFFRDKCKHTKYFYCQIVLNDYKLIIIDNDLQKLLSINEGNIFYFQGFWKDFRRNWFTKTSSDYKVIRHTNICEPVGYGIGIVHILFDKGIDVKIIEPFIPQLIESYRHDCKEAIIDWETKRDLITSMGMSNGDKILFKQVKELIRDFPHTFVLECSASESCMIAWNTIQIVINSGGEDDVIAYLSKHSWIKKYENQEYQKIRDIKDEEKRRESAKKIAELIRDNLQTL